MKKLSQFPYEKPASVYKCPMCPFTSGQYKLLVEHTTIVHRVEEAKYKCALCKYTTNLKGQFYEHLTSHSNNNVKIPIYTCKLCKNRTRYSEAELKVHQKSHHGKDAHVFRCSKCSYKSVSESCFKRHLDCHDSSSETATYKCKFCEFESNFHTRFKRHLKSHFKKVKKDDGTYLAVYDHDNTLKFYQCNKCSFVTKDKLSMECHGSVHNCSSHVCGLCDYVSKDKIGLLQHFMSVHK